MIHHSIALFIHSWLMVIFTEYNCLIDDEVQFDKKSKKILLSLQSSVSGDFMYKVYTENELIRENECVLGVRVRKLDMLSKIS